MVREIEHGLRQIRGLGNTAHLDGAFFFNDFADQAQQVGRELIHFISAAPCSLHKRRRGNHVRQDDQNKTYLRVPPVLPRN